MARRRPTIRDACGWGMAALKPGHVGELEPLGACCIRIVGRGYRSALQGRGDGGVGERRQLLPLPRQRGVGGGDLRHCRVQPVRNAALLSERWKTKFDPHDLFSRKVLNRGVGRLSSISLR